MKKKEIIMLIIIFILLIALTIMSKSYLDFRKISDTTVLGQSQKIFELNKRIEELENLKSEKEIVNTYTFYAEIKEIIEKDEKVTLLVDGLDVNNINNRGEFYITIDKEVKLIWQGVNLDMSELKVGQNISITHDGGIQETAPARIPNVYIVELLDDNI